jgi:hypothetical protein
MASNSEGCDRHTDFFPLIARIFADFRKEISKAGVSAHRMMAGDEAARSVGSSGGVQFGLRRHVAAFSLADMSASSEARACPRTPNLDAAVHFGHSRE